MKKGKRLTLGYIYGEKTMGKDEKLFISLCKKRKINLIMINIDKKIDENELEEKAKKCDIIFNNSADEFAYEIIKTLEELGKKVIDSSKTYYYTEDKWIFYLKCKENNIPTPETILLSENINIARKNLKDFNHWPVVLKRVWGTMGEYVEKADNILKAEYVIKKFWEKGNEKLPVIAQELIHSPSYRVTAIGKEIVQTALKESKGWKCTGVYEKEFEKFKIDKELEKIIKKVIPVVGINVCGIDLLKKEGKWVVLEVNSTPAFDFFENEREMLIGKVLNFLKKQVK